MSAIPATEQALARPEFSRLLWMLPDEDQPVMAHRFGGGLTVNQISGLLDRPAQSVRDTIRRSLDLLRARLKPELATRKSR